MMISRSSSGAVRKRAHGAHDALHRAGVFRLGWQVEDGAQVFEREHARIIVALPDIEALDDEGRRQAVRHRHEGRSRRFEACRAAEIEG